MEQKKILLIGGTGFVGHRIASLLSSKGHRVTIPVHHEDRHGDLRLLPGVDLTKADVNNPESLASLMQGIDAVINLVGILHDRDSSKPYGKHFSAAHVELPEKIVSAMKQKGIRRLVHISALRSASDAPSAYLRSKAAGEAVVMGAASDLDVTVFRPSVIFGIHDAFLNTFASLLDTLPVLPLACSSVRVQPVFVGDVAEAVTRSLGDPAASGQIYELCGPQVYTLRELVDYVARLTGKRRLIINLPRPLAYLQAVFLGLLPNPLMSPDNLKQPDSISDGGKSYPGWFPAPLEAIVPGYLSDTLSDRLDAFRCRAGR